MNEVDKSNENITDSKDSLQGFFSPVHKDHPNFLSFNTENPFKDKEAQAKPFNILQKNHTSFSFQQ